MLCLHTHTCWSYGRMHIYNYYTELRSVRSMEPCCQLFNVACCKIEKVSSYIAAWYLTIFLFLSLLYKSMHAFSSHSPIASCKYGYTQLPQRLKFSQPCKPCFPLLCYVNVWVLEGPYKLLVVADSTFHGWSLGGGGGSLPKSPCSCVASSLIL